MATKKPAKATKATKSTKSTKSKQATHPRKGLLFALGAIPLGIAAWLFLWQFGFIASIVAWGIAGVAVWLYAQGAKGEVSKATAPWMILIILVGVLLAFLSGMISDLWGFYTSDGGTQDFWSNEFWTFVWDNMTYDEYLRQYVPDFLLSLVFAALGAGNIVYKLFKTK